MKVLLLGKNGQVGWELNRVLPPLGEVIALGREGADLSNPESLRKVVRNIHPDVIINAAAYTAVDKAEKEEDLAAAINGVAPGVLAEETKNIDALLVHYSTDYVFDGKKETPYVETDEPNPINVYGRTKFAGERAIQSSGCDYIIFRASWVYSNRGNNFFLTMLKLAKERDELSVVSDQVGSPTSARLIAEATLHCLRQVIREKQDGVFSSGLYHLAASGYTSWNGFAKEIIDSEGKRMNLGLTSEDVKEIATSDYPTTATRPLNSRLDLTKLKSVFGVEIPTWRQALSQTLKDFSEQ